jgi:aspartate/methionine/tyrosine aminotransferase
MRAGHNQYPPMTGVPALREAIAAKIGPLYGHAYDAATEITVTAGATQALTTAILCCVHPGDEVIVIEPAYDSYAAGHHAGRRRAGAGGDGSGRERLQRALGRRSRPRSRRAPA